MLEDLEAGVAVGSVLAGKYRVDRVLGVGGMGVVVAAMHLQLDQLVALKFIRREALANTEIVSRFEREARSAVRLRSVHVARIIDVGRLESGSPYIVMEYLEGRDLASLLEQQRQLAVATACDYLIQACDAIAEAHSLGIVHRDLKPGNLFLATTSHGQQLVKVLDFGISKNNASPGDARMTQTQAVMGSPGYMSPEQMRSTKNVDGRSDIWSLGVILYELVTGRIPFHSDTFSGLCLKIAMDPLPPLPPLPAALPTGFEAMMNRALEKDPAQRYATAVEFAHALAPFASASGRDRAYQLMSLSDGGPVTGAHLRRTVAAPSTLDDAAGQAKIATVSVRLRGLRASLLVASAICVVALLVGIGAALVGGGTAPSAIRATAPIVDVSRVRDPPTDAGAPARLDATRVVAEPVSPESAPPPTDAGVPPVTDAGALPAKPFRPQPPRRPPIEIPESPE